MSTDPRSTMSFPVTEMLANDTIEVLDKGFVALDGALASDLAVVNGARVSFNQNLMARVFERAHAGGS